MTVPATTPTATTPTPATTSSTSSTDNTNALAQLSGNFQTFLSLLTTQLQNQDPLSPLDSNQFTQQLTQMSGVEAQLQANALLQQVANNTGTGIATAVSLIGKQVKATSSTANLTGGQAQWTYNLPAAATDLKLSVVNAAGQVVHVEAPSDMSAGDHTLTWNGKDLGGVQLPDGAYTLQVTATDATGTAIATSTFVQGKVTGVEQTGGTTMMTVNGTQVPWNQVVTVTDSTAAGGS
ncbi:MAG TPA: flagellar hook assembly protein FlgD [Phenylobacterium sp.]|jgi:flagellar basal-body rod modification protein FlgD|nr:flagellar hook assembly protein FlgD [Phenylobacterium sp.]